MQECEKIDISEGIDVNQTNLSKECDICCYWFFKDIGFKYEKYLCNGFHDLMQKAMSFNNVAIVYVKGNASRINCYMSKDDAIKIMNGSNLIDKSGFLYIFFYFSFVIYKNEWEYWFKINKALMLNKAKD